MPSQAADRVAEPDQNQLPAHVPEGMVGVLYAVEWTDPTGASRIDLATGRGSAYELAAMLRDLQTRKNRPVDARVKKCAHGPWVDDTDEQDATDAWVEAGMDATQEPDPDYGRDLDFDEPPF